MKYLLGLILSAFLLISPAQAEQKCEKATQEQFLAEQKDLFATQGVILSFNLMKGDQLKKFLDTVSADLIAKGYPPQMIMNIFSWDTIAWARATNPQDKSEWVLVAAFTEGCLKDADVWSKEVFDGFADKAFGSGV